MIKLAISPEQLAPPAGPYPARTTIAVAALPLGACVEIDMVVQ